MAVVNPGKMNHNMWEERINQLETQFKEKAISELLKVAIITSAAPNKVQDYIFSQPEKDPSYAQIKEMIITYSSRMADNGPNAMDIGAVERQDQWDNWERNGWQEDQWEEDQWQGDQWGQQQDGSIPYDVNGVQDHSNSICYTCNQKGHISPQCPKGKGKWKNGKGKGKGGKGFSGKGYGQFQPKGGWNMKGWWNGGSKGGNGKGKGKGYQGQCWGCGQIGHKQDECSNRQQRVQAVQPVQQGQPAQTMGPVAFPEPVHPKNVISQTSAGFTQVGSVPVNSVWMVGDVEAHYKPVATQNMFGAIESKDED